MSNLFAEELRRAANGWGRDMGQAQLLNSAAREVEQLEARLAAAEKVVEAARTIVHEARRAWDRHEAYQAVTPHPQSDMMHLARMVDAYRNEGK